MVRSKAAVVTDFRRQQILESARATFVRKGLAGTTVSEIAHGANVAKGTVYLYFRSKDEILRQLLDDALVELYDDTVPLVTGAGTWEAKLRGFLDRTLAFYDRQHDFLEQCHFELTREMRKNTKRGVGRIFAAQTRAWRAALNRGQRGERLSVAPTRAAAGVVSFAYGLGHQRLHGWLAGSRQDVVEWGSKLLLEGLRAS